MISLRRSLAVARVGWRSLASAAPNVENRRGLPPFLREDQIEIERFWQAQVT